MMIRKTPLLSDDLCELYDGTPDNPEWHALRAKHITSSNVAALWNTSPYTSELELWSEHTGAIDRREVKPHERMKFGSAFEPAITAMVAERINSRVVPYKRYIYSDELRIGSSFDSRVHDAKSPYRGWLVECKNVDGMVFHRQGNDWHDDSGIVLPAHIELQCHHQMVMHPAPGVLLAAFVGGNQLYVVEVPRNDTICQAIVDRIARFWRMVDERELPELDYSRDAKVIIAMHQSSGDNDVDMSDNAELNHLAWEFMKVKNEEKHAIERCTELKARMLDIIGDDVDRVYLADGVSIPCKMRADTPEKTVTVTADMVGETIVTRPGKRGWRGFQVNQSKAKRSAP